MAEAANARAQADREAARLAELYKADPLLAFFSVPRFRLPTVKLSVPVAIEEIPQGAPPPALEQAPAAVGNAIRQEMARRGMALSEAQSSTLTRSLEQAAKGLADDPRARESEIYLADALTSVAAEAIAAHGRGERPGEAGEPSPKMPSAPELRDLARLAVMGARTPLAGVIVKATSAELSEVNPNTILHVDLTLSEQGLEWSGAEDDKARLTPE